MQRLSAKWVSEKFYIHQHDHCAFWYFIPSPLVGSIHFLCDSELSSCQNVCDDSIFKYKSRPILRLKKKKRVELLVLGYCAILHFISVPSYSSESYHQTNLTPNSVYFYFFLSFKKKKTFRKGYVWRRL